MQILAAGCGEGEIIKLDTPLSFWGGFDVRSGRIIDRSHPACGEVLARRILAMPSGRGSSSASSVLAEAILEGTAPAGIILSEPDPILAVGAIVAQRLYNRSIPIVICDALEYSELPHAGRIRITAELATPPRVRLVPYP